MLENQPKMQSERRAANGKIKAKSYKDLLVWQKGITLVKKVYQLTRTFPDAEKFGLTSQMRRAAVSIPSNIAEGQARHTRREFIQFLPIPKAPLPNWRLRSSYALSWAIARWRTHKKSQASLPN